MNPVPVQIQHEDDGSVRLWFAEDEAHPLDGTYFLRGGICWPGELTKAPFEESQVGFVVVAGIRTGGDAAIQPIEVFAEKAFASARNVVADGRVAEEGLCPWMARTLGLFGCLTYYTPRSVGRAETFIRDVRRGGWETTRAVKFLNVEETLDDALGMMVDAQNERRLRYGTGGELHLALRDYKASQGNAVGAALAAAARLCAGIKRHPPRARKAGWRIPFSGE